MSNIFVLTSKTNFYTLIRLKTYGFSGTNKTLLKQSVLVSENATPVIGRKFTIGDLKPHTLYELKIKQSYKNQQNGGFTVYNFTTKMTGRSCNKIII